MLALSACGPKDGNYSLSARGDVRDATLSVSSPVEYSKEPVNLFEHVTCSDSGVSLSAQDDVTATEVGTQTVSIVLSKGFFERTERLEVPVVDTQPPTIELSQESVAVEMGETVDAGAYVASVVDPVDGELGRVDRQPKSTAVEAGKERFYDEGWYLAPRAELMSKAGAHDLDIVAEDRHGNRSTATLHVTVTDPLDDVSLTPTAGVLEYDTKETDAVKLVTCSDKEVTVTADEVAPSKVGKFEVTYTLSKRSSTRDETVTFEVQDTKAPTIKLKKDKVTIKMGDSFDPATCVEKVSDPVDGELKKAAKQPEVKGKAAHVGHEQFYDAGWYCVTGKVDVKTPGTYQLKIVASDRHGNEASKKLAVTVADPLADATLTPRTGVLEYSTKKTDATKLVTCSVKDATVSADQLDLSQVGTQTVTYTVALGASSRAIEVSFEVRDTKEPAIALVSNEVDIEYGAPYDPYSNVASVADEVDGGLARVEAEPSEPGDGWYTIAGSLDPSQANKYFLTVVACDRNGNRVTKEFSVSVGDPPSPQGETYGVQADNGRDYVLNTNTYKFHYPSCGHVNSMSAGNRRDVHKTRDEVIGMGYSPCGHCNP